MTDEIDILKKTIMTYERAIKVKDINEQLYEQLMGSLYYICKYAEKYNIPLPEKEVIYDLIERCRNRFDNMVEIVTHHSPPEFQQRKKTPDDETEPKYYSFSPLQNIIITDIIEFIDLTCIFYYEYNLFISMRLL